jgi:glucose/mannose-6-phosphate isomerase
MSMKKLVEEFSQQIRESIEISEKAVLTQSAHPIHNIFISGLGGSGIGGSIVAEIVSEEASVPIIVNKDYFIPAFVNQNTLALICSYSGNTEETISAMELAIKQKAKIVCITAGGKISEMAKAHGIDCIYIPAGRPPRASLGYSGIQLFKVLHFFGIIGNGYLADLKKAADLLDAEEKNIKSEAMDIAKKFVGKIPVIYTLGGTEAIAVRFRQQVNENGKMLCWHHVIPEMNHNELVGWTHKNENLIVVAFRNSTDFYRTVKRLEVNKTVFEKYTPHYVEIHSKGNSKIERAMYHVHIGDWISCYIADINNIDATEVNVINHLKGELAKV